ncbi:Lon protease family protein [Halodesulfovibrio marinisediminis]|uniref:endopeptidase La n=1 Tax=Halodesulfovibrio marinisediminis DSM 17456 TaxID=1121457 RepID=A0A1N6J8M9_9BACT|nr:ATP-binding protein [Halodesulfovibrio marinisediminis]SIO40728.1 Lon-like ATP-dependent protease [Halodesulfovibrio marinisediminis DSM 17456]
MTDITEQKLVPIDKLRWKVDPTTLPFSKTSDLEQIKDIIGQKRGVEAFRFGVGVEAKGYNIFVTGEADVGKMGMVRQLLENSVRRERSPKDLCYVNNFKNPEQPILLTFDAGEGQLFKKNIEEFLEDIKREIPQLFESQEYINSKNALLEEHDKKTRDFFKGLEERVKEAGFVLVNMQMGQVQRPDIVPVVDGEPTHLLKLEEMVDKGRFPRDEFVALQEKYKELKEEIDSIFMDVRRLQKAVKAKSEEVDRLMFMNTANELARKLFEDWKEHEKVYKHLKAMLENMAEQLDVIKMIGQQQAGPVQGMHLPTVSAEAVLHPYGVNLLVDNSESDGPPIIIESFPTYRNLFGSIERVMDRSGLWRTDFQKINAGSFIKANGGFLVINLLDAIAEPGVWQTLKRALKTSELEIQTFDPFSFMASTGIKPESISMDVKVVVLATTHLYQLLKLYDPEVEMIFKVRADFDSSMDKTDDGVNEFCRLVATYADKRKLKAFSNDAVGLLLEHSVRKSGRQEKLSTSFPVIGDIMAEAEFFAKSAEKEVVGAEHVQEALDARIYREGLIEEKIQEMIDRGSIFIDTEGGEVGQINGLAVYSTGDLMFGKPSRITCTTSMGKEGIINIERDAKLSGPSHNKGMLILSGYLRQNFAQDKPLTLSASIAFEQSYGGVDGDSASTTELYALLSSLSQVPIKQGIAVTGSVNQNGEVQPIGGVNEKVEGFYTVCKAKGLTRDQGVLIPAANVKDLMLKQEVVDAVNEGKFSVWAIKDVREGIEILTGVPAGERDAEGNYYKGSVYGLVDTRLAALAEGLRDFHKGKKNGDEDNDEE